MESDPAHSIALLKKHIFPHSPIPGNCSRTDGTTTFVFYESLDLTCWWNGDFPLQCSGRCVSLRLNVSSVFSALYVKITSHTSKNFPTPIKFLPYKTADVVCPMRTWDGGRVGWGMGTSQRWHTAVLLTDKNRKSFPLLFCMLSAHFCPGTAIPFYFVSEGGLRLSLCPNGLTLYLRGDAN